MLVGGCHKDDVDNSGYYNAQKQLAADTEKIKEYLSANNIEAECYQNVFYEVLEEGDGVQCKAGHRVACKYRLTTVGNPDKVIDESDKRAFLVQLDNVVPSQYAGVIYGFQIALVTMKEHGKSRFYIPSALAYASQPIGGEQFANLIFEIELCEILNK